MHEVSHGISHRLIAPFLWTLCLFLLPCASVAAVDLDVMDDLHNSVTFDTLVKEPEIMHFIDQDKYMSEVFRAGTVLPSTLNAKKERHNVDR